MQTTLSGGNLTINEIIDCAMNNGSSDDDVKLSQEVANRHLQMRLTTQTEPDRSKEIAYLNVPDAAWDASDPPQIDSAMRHQQAKLTNNLDKRIQAIVKKDGSQDTVRSCSALHPLLDVSKMRLADCQHLMRPFYVAGHNDDPFYVIHPPTMFLPALTSRNAPPLTQLNFRQCIGLAVTFPARREQHPKMLYYVMRPGKSATVNHYQSLDSVDRRHSLWTQLIDCVVKCPPFLKLVRRCRSNITINVDYAIPQQHKKFLIITIRNVPLLPQCASILIRQRALVATNDEFNSIVARVLPKIVQHFKDTVSRTARLKTVYSESRRPQPPPPSSASMATKRKPPAVSLESGGGAVTAKPKKKKKPRLTNDAAAAADRSLMPPPADVPNGAGAGAASPTLQVKTAKLIVRYASSDKAPANNVFAECSSVDDLKSKVRTPFGHVVQFQRWAGDDLIWCQLTTTFDQMSTSAHFAKSDIVAVRTSLTKSMAAGSTAREASAALLVDMYKGYRQQKTNAANARKKVDELTKLQTKTQKALDEATAQLADAQRELGAVPLQSPTSPTGNANRTGANDDEWSFDL